MWVVEQVAAPQDVVATVILGAERQLPTPQQQKVLDRLDAAVAAVSRR